MAKNAAQIKGDLNRSNRAAANADLGGVLADLVTKHNALLAKLDADTGVASTDYAATLAVKPSEAR